MIDSKIIQILTNTLTYSTHANAALCKNAMHFTSQDKKKKGGKKALYSFRGKDDWRQPLVIS